MLASHDLEPRDALEAFLENDVRKDLLRFTTAGSVDDGKSTLIGRLLHDSKSVYEDQLDAVRKSRINRSGKSIDFSLLTDGLRAEREQGITIDVAYRYFSTPRRKFIIADTPGHEQYTRNMATGASTADLAIVLLDATKGVLPQTRRHAYIAALLGIPHVVAAINKMDLAAYNEDTFLPLQRDFVHLARSLRIPMVHCIPISALEGDNVVARGTNMLWYTGPALLDLLETVEIQRPLAADFRFPIQYVVRPGANFRGFAGRVASGAVQPGDAVLALPSGRQTTVQSILTYSGALDEAVASQSVVLRLADEIDLNRGDMLVSPGAPPHVSASFAAMLVWLDARELRLNHTYLLKHAGKTVKATARRVRFRVDVNDLSERTAASLEMNGIAAVEFVTTSPIFFDPYRRNRTTGSFILIDPLSNATVGAGMIFEDLHDAGEIHGAEPALLPGKLAEENSRAVSLGERTARHGHMSALLLVRENLALRLERTLFQNNFEVIRITQSEALSETLEAVLSVLWSAGFVVVYASAAPSEAELALCERIAGPAFLDLRSGSQDQARDRSANLLSRAVKFAETLRRPFSQARQPTEKEGDNP